MPQGYGKGPGTTPSRQQRGLGYVPARASSAKGGGSSGGGITVTPGPSGGEVSLEEIADQRLLANYTGSTAVPVPTELTTALDSLSSAQGSILYRGPSAWVALAPGTNGQFLKTQGAGSNPAWATITPGTGTVTSVGLSAPAIFSVSSSPVTTSGTLALSLATQSANLVWAGPSTGAAAAPTFRSLVAADLPNTAVTPGSYTAANITVDAQGRITAAANGSGGGGGTVTSVNLASADGTITPTGGPITTSGSIDVSVVKAPKWSTGRTITLTGDASATSGAFDGSANLSFSVTVNQAAKWTTARTLSFTGDVTGSGSVDGSASVATAMTLANSGVTAGSYTSADITVDAKGRVTAAANGSGGSGALVLISEVVTSGSQSSVTFSSIPATYRDLEVRVRGRASGVCGIYLRFNSDSGANYQQQFGRVQGTTFTGLTLVAQNQAGTGTLPTASSYTSLTKINISNYKDTSWYKSVIYDSMRVDSNNTSFGMMRDFGANIWLSTAAISTILVACDSGANFVNGCVVSLYGQY